ncbi:MAG: mechanosensitive ion channel family protein [Desulfomonile tiedjei]|nr:mechanosensitive ion channel family protein [Desulfomonile tiedjei]
MYGQAVWQWTGLFLYFIIGIGAVVLIHKWSDTLLAIVDRKFGWRLEHTVGGLSLPVSLIFFAAIGLWLMVYGLHFLNADLYVPIALVFLFVSYLGWIWLIGATFNRLSDAFVSLGGFVREGMDAQLIRLGFQIVTVIIIGVTAIFLGARLGLPTYSLVTGLGIGGLAVALAGREALSNVIGTVMIILDRTFKLGDYIVLDSGERGVVAEVGIRSTRIRTRDDILISIPNAVIANAKMINESAPVSTHRIRIPVGVAYGSNLKEVERILLGVAEQTQLVVPTPAPRVRFRRFGDSALELELLCWIDPPELKGETTHHLNRAIYEEFQGKGIEIPFPQRDVHILRNQTASRENSDNESSGG